MLYCYLAKHSGLKDKSGHHLHGRESLKYVCEDKFNSAFWLCDLKILNLWTLISSIKLECWTRLSLMVYLVLSFFAFNMPVKEKLIPNVCPSYKKKKKGWIIFMKILKLRAVILFLKWAADGREFENNLRIKLTQSWVFVGYQWWKPLFFLDFFDVYIEAVQEQHFHISDCLLYLKIKKKVRCYLPEHCV